MTVNKCFQNKQSYLMLKSKINPTSGRYGIALLRGMLKLWLIYGLIYGYVFIYGYRN